MNDNSTHEAISDLNALELATLVCLVAEEHCIVRAPSNLLEPVSEELERIGANVFALQCAALNCTENTGLDDFSETVLAKDVDGTNGSIEEEFSSRDASTSAIDKQTEAPRPTNILDSRKICNMIIAKNLDQAPWNVQIQALELMRSRRIFSRTAIHTAPKRFIFIALLSDDISGPPFLTPHLNDHFFISHHIPTASALTSQTRASSSQPRIATPTLTRLSHLTSHVRVAPALRRYTHDVLTFLRLHRAVGGGVSALAARHLLLLTCVLAPLHALTYTTPALVKLAARKALPHRVEIVEPLRERSLQWGSNEGAVREALEGVEVDAVVEEVLEDVPVPL